MLSHKDGSKNGVFIVAQPFDKLEKHGSKFHVGLTVKLLLSY